MPTGRKRVPSNAQAADDEIKELQEKLNLTKDGPYNAIDLFKLTHWSRKKNCFSGASKEAIDRMEAIVAESAQEGQVPKTPEAVAQVLGNTKFLQNVGILPPPKKRNAKSAVSAHVPAPKKRNVESAVSAHVQEREAEVDELEAQVQSEKQGLAALWGKIDVQQDALETLQLKVDELEETRKKQAEEIENLKKQGEETNSLLRCLLRLNKE